MNKDSAQVWDRTWSSREKIAFDLNTRVIFENIAKRVSFTGRTVLELGCGSGRLSYLAYQAGAKELTLVDFSEEALRIAKNIFSGVGKVTFIQASLLDLNLSQKYDIVFSSGVVEHFKDELLPLAIEAHAKYSREYIIVVVPSDTIFNKRRSASLQNIQRYGYQKPISPKQMEMLFNETNIIVKLIRRFHVMYGVPLPRVYGIGTLRALLTSVLRPLESFTGGLLIGVGKL